MVDQLQEGRALLRGAALRHGAEQGNGAALSALGEREMDPLAGLGLSRPRKAEEEAVVHAVPGGILHLRDGRAGVIDLRLMAKAPAPEPKPARQQRQGQQHRKDRPAALGARGAELQLFDLLLLAEGAEQRILRQRGAAEFTWFHIALTPGLPSDRARSYIAFWD